MPALSSNRGVMFIALLLISFFPVQAQVPDPGQPPAEEAASAARDLFIVAGKSVVVQTPEIIQRVVLADPQVAEALAVSPREIVVHGRALGETSLIIWLQSGARLLFDVKVSPSEVKRLAALEAVERELARLLPGQEISVSLEDSNLFLSGVVNDITSAQRAEAIAAAFGKPVNLLNVKTPPVEGQILLKVRFANVDRAASTELGVNLISTGALNTTALTSTGQFAALQVQPTGAGVANFTLRDALNIFLFRPDLDFGVVIKALENKRLLEVLAEPNVLAINGKSASFLAGGEFPYPTLQGGGAGLGAVTIQFREFGVRINFLPRITPRGTIRLQVTPEVSALDFANGLVFQGFTIPALSTRRVQTEIELDNGQSFAIGGLLDNRVTEAMNKIPGLGDLPILGYLFRSKSFQQNNSELLVLVTPELVRPIPAGKPVPALDMPLPFLEGAPTQVPRTPGMDVTGPVPVKPAQETVPLEQLLQIQQEEKAPPASQAGAAPVEFVPATLVPVRPGQPQQQPPAAPAPQPQPQAPAPAPTPPPASGSNGGSR